MNRPLGVILTAILLGLLAASEGVTVAIMGVLFLPNHPRPLMGFLGMWLSLAGAVVWLILTLIGLLRLHSWARYSVLVIASLIVVGAVMGAARSFSMLEVEMAQRVAFFIRVGYYVVIAAIGVALLAYYNLAKTRALFSTKRELQA